MSTSCWHVHSERKRGWKPVAETTWEEASRCPKCNQPGEDVKETKTRNGRGKDVVVHTVFCRNPICIWLDTSWLVQINEDGSIPKAYEQLGNKKYPKLSPELETRVQEAIQAQLKAETQPGGAEIRNPHG